MMFDSDIILVTKQRLINSILYDRMAVWILTFGILLVKWGQCPMIQCATETVPNRIDEIHISQQRLSKLDIRTYTIRRFACAEVISVLHKSHNFRFHLSAESYVDDAVHGLVDCFVRNPE